MSERKGYHFSVNATVGVLTQILPPNPRRRALILPPFPPQTNGYYLAFGELPTQGDAIGSGGRGILMRNDANQYLVLTYEIFGNWICEALFAINFQGAFVTITGTEIIEL